MRANRKIVILILSLILVLSMALVVNGESVNNEEPVVTETPAIEQIVITDNISDSMRGRKIEYLLGTYKYETLSKEKVGQLEGVIIDEIFSLEEESEVDVALSKFETTKKQYDSNAKKASIWFKVKVFFGLLLIFAIGVVLPNVFRRRRKNIFRGR